ncbi:shikimate dehydrogenase [Neomicrococcus aestuarii]|uniref:Shikimate dehydrogenase n=1 Tax=Neomicrococcus aestuarii TaxID=556325 RepID=A0A7W8TSA6_9MICC|nr:shikimate dehydrogenase [Neomicrococcus aestuarii]MBB5512007.1 shikimate dehydrogenase [Neomicrococcus aestuarii]
MQVGAHSEGLRAAVIGSPISHSKSPLLHGAAYQALGLDIEYTRREAVETDAAALNTMLRNEPGWLGLSCTMPMKQALIPFLDNTSERVRILGAMNTVVVHRTDGEPVKLSGENTDVDGLIKSIAAMGATVLKNVAIFGAGNTASAAIMAVAESGAEHIDFVVRNLERAAASIALAQSFGLTANAILNDAAAFSIPEYDAAISTLPPGSADSFVDKLGLENLRPGTPLMDVTYDPWPSRLASAWTEHGGVAASGLTMLLYQAVEQVKLFTGVTEADWDHVINMMCDAVGLTRPQN